jgi:hypothetical protein
LIHEYNLAALIAALERQRRVAREVPKTRDKDSTHA